MDGRQRTRRRLLLLPPLPPLVVLLLVLPLLPTLTRSTTLAAADADADADAATNWARNVVWRAARVSAPADAAALAQLVRSAAAADDGDSNARRLRAVGTRHSFSAVADTSPGGHQISTRRLRRVLDVDTATRRIKVEAGITYNEVGLALDKVGLALPNYASLSHISVAGAVQTSTHGSGVGNQILASAVHSFEVVRHDGTVVTLHRDDPLFHPVLVGVGSTGIVTALVLQAEPAFDVRQCIYPYVPFSLLLDDVAGFFGRGYSVSGFTDWSTPGQLSSVWIKTKLEAGGDDSGPCPALAGVAARAFHPLPERDPADCSPVGVGPSKDMLPHFLPNRPPSSGGDELQSEYFVSLSDAADAVRALATIQTTLSPHVLVTEFRIVSPDRFPLSVCYDRPEPCVGLHFTWKKELPLITDTILPLLERTLNPWAPRPHHGKLHTITPSEWVARYGEAAVARVRAAALAHDPQGVFRNEWANTYLFHNHHDGASAAEL